MKPSIHHVFAGLTAATLGAGAMALAAHSNPTPGASLAKQFTAQDRAVFTHGFHTADGLCEVGYSQQGLCFEPSPLESRIVKGEPFPHDMYPLALEWRAALAMPRKAEHLKTIRIGQTVALVDRETGMVTDMIRLGETVQAGSMQPTLAG